MAAAFDPDSPDFEFAGDQDLNRPCDKDGSHDYLHFGDGVAVCLRGGELALIVPLSELVAAGFPVSDGAA